MNYDPKTSVFTRSGSFRAPSLTEQQSEPAIPLNAPPQPPPFLQSSKGIVLVQHSYYLFENFIIFSEK